MTPQAIPQPLAEFLDEDTIQFVGSGAEFPEGTPAERYARHQRRQRLLKLARHAGRCANYTLIAAGALTLLWIAAQIFVAFHSGRVKQIVGAAKGQGSFLQAVYPFPQESEIYMPVPSKSAGAALRCRMSKGDGALDHCELLSGASLDDLAEGLRRAFQRNVEDESRIGVLEDSVRSLTLQLGEGCGSYTPR